MVIIGKIINERGEILMSIEEKVFKNEKLNKEKLLAFGFNKEGNSYKYSKEFMDGTFRADIYVDEAGNVSGKVYDLETGEEYTNFRIVDVVGEFVNTVKKEYIQILNEIKDNCFEKDYDSYDTKKEWLVPANPKYYDVMNAFNNQDIITWKQSNNINEGDIVYLYVAVPYSAIMFKCEVVETNIPYQYKDKNLSIKRVMKIKLLKRYKQDEFTFKKLKEYGIRAVRGPRSVTSKLSQKLNETKKAV